MYPQQSIWYSTGVLGLLCIVLFASAEGQLVTKERVTHPAWCVYGGCANVAGERFGNATIPLGVTFSGAVWSDKLALTPYREYLELGDRTTLRRLFAQLLNQSFDLNNMSADETSNRITNAVRGGISIFSAASMDIQTPPLYGFITNINSHLDIHVRLPEAPLLLIFSDHDGLKRGADLPLTHLDFSSSAITSLTALKNTEIAANSLIDGLNNIFRSHSLFNRLFLQYGFSMVFGHAYLEMHTQKGGIHMNKAGTELYVDADVRLRSAGISLNKMDKFSINAANGFPVHGVGAGVNAGVYTTGKQIQMGIRIYDVGPIVWSCARTRMLQVRTANISVNELFEHHTDLFDEKKGGYFPNLDSGDILYGVSPFVRSLPTRCGIMCSYQFYFSQNQNAVAAKFCNEIASAIEYRQNIAPWPGRSRVPGVLLTTTLKLLEGHIPVRIGWMCGENRGVTSHVAVGISGRRVSFFTGFDAIGTPYWFPERGCAVYAGIISHFVIKNDSQSSNTSG